MKKKLIIIILVVLVIVSAVVVLFMNGNVEYETNEIQPEEEISDDQLRQTMISLYFVDINSGKLESEAKLIDAKVLLSNPYEVLVNYLIEGPKSSLLKKVIPEGTKLNSATLKAGTLYIDFSNEFVENQEEGEIAESNTIYSIINTVTELNEVNSVKILINGEENKSFKDNKINFSEAFVRKDI